MEDISKLNLIMTNIRRILWYRLGGSVDNQNLYYTIVSEIEIYLRSVLK